MIIISNYHKDLLDLVKLTCCIRLLSSGSDERCSIALSQRLPTIEITSESDTNSSASCISAVKSIFCARAFAFSTLRIALSTGFWVCAGVNDVVSFSVAESHSALRYLLLWHVDGLKIIRTHNGVAPLQTNCTRFIIPSDGKQVK